MSVSLTAAAAVLSLVIVAAIVVAAALAKVARESAAAVIVAVAADFRNRAGLAALQLRDVSGLEAGECKAEACEGGQNDD